MPSKPVWLLSNSTAYSAYKLYFPNVRDSGNANSMQVGELQFYTGANATGTGVLAAGQDIRAIDNPGSDSGYTVDQSGSTPSRIAWTTSRCGWSRAIGILCSTNTDGSSTAARIDSAV